MDLGKAILQKLKGWFGDTTSERAWFLGCSLVALIAVWAHRYPVGIDLPQHANLFRLWTELGSGPLEYRQLYRIELFTPYLLPYALAFPLTKLFGALAAVKILFSAVAVGTPLLMRRWLRMIGGDPRFALVGFVTAFGFPYIWGFFSNVVSLPLVFAYFICVESLGDTPRLPKLLLASLFGIALFLSHGITFGMAAASAGLAFLLRGRWLARWRVLLHFVPMVLTAALWLAVRHKQASNHPVQDYLNWERVVTLFSGAFLPYPDERYALLAAVGVVLFLALARPRLRLQPGRVAPFALALLGFLAIPDWIASTWLVGSRLCVFVHAFSPAILQPRETDVVGRNFMHVLGALVLAVLGLLNVRLYDFNQELAGMDEVARRIPPGADLQTLVPETDSTSRVFGPGQLGQVPAWITAERGGLIENDSGAAIYYQIPIKRNDVPFPSQFRYVLAHGGERRFGGRLRQLTGAARPLQTAGGWMLYERRHVETDDYEVVRHAQGWGNLAVNRSVAGVHLGIAGTKYSAGLGGHANSFIRLRLKRPAQRLVGACGIDDSAGGHGEAVFRIRDDSGKVLFESGLMRGGMPAAPFRVALGDAREVLLEAKSPGSIASAHADWVNLGLE